ncbi:amidohydrolase family protein [Marinibaculum pumilum]|uniref:Amidohydrolase family protein n=1 Tax=Marinibaculum pumilum TaxID=1766165 RepID=A0ABV7L3D4_9PROT
MIIDSHAHVVMPETAYRYMADLVSSRGNPRAGRKIPDDEILLPPTEKLLKQMDDVGTDIQFLSPRPFAQMHSVRPGTVTELWTRYVNDIIAWQCRQFPDRFRGVAGLPQFRDTSPENCLEELERCVKELGFVGCLINPDPVEGDGAPPPGMGDEFWYPLYEKLVELDVPALVHSASCCHARESYTLKFINEESIAIISLLESKVFEDFPNLKIVVSHGGGAIPYQMGRFRAWHLRRKKDATFDDLMRKLYFDTCNYSEEALDLLFRVVGTDNCMFGTERPGTGSVHNPDWGHDFDNLKPVIEGIGWLSEADRKKIFEDNCRKVYTRAFK